VIRIDWLDPSYYTVADGDGQTTAAREAGLDVDGDPGPAAQRRPSVLRATEQILDQHNFDGYVEDLCERFYVHGGRPGVPPGRYFRLLLIGYFEGLDAERAIAWHLVRRDTGESYQDFLTKLAQAVAPSPARVVGVQVGVTHRSLIAMCRS
jgi:hypothetical protein